jgi:16S rRNA processing protein RimM
MNIKDCYPIGRVLRPHGLKGEVTLTLEHGAPDRLDTLEVLYLDQQGSLIPYFIGSASIKGRKAYVKFHDVDTFEQAKEISNRSMYLPKSKRPPLQKGQFYKDEVIGFKVLDVDLGALGSISDVIQSGEQSLIVVSGGTKEILIPVNGPFIKGIERKREVIHVELPEGFLDI